MGGKGYRKGVRGRRKKKRGERERGRKRKGRKGKEKGKRKRRRERKEKVSRCHFLILVTTVLKHAIGFASNVVVVSVPVNKLGNSLFNRRQRAETDGIIQGTDIGIGGRYVSWLHRQHISIRFGTQLLFNDFDEVVQFHRPIVADVVETIGGTA